MARKKRPTPVPAPNVRRHGTGFRGVVSILGKRTFGPTFPTVAQASAWVSNVTRAEDTGSQEPLTLTTALDLLLQDLRDSGAAAGTEQFYRRAHLELTRVLGADIELHRISAPAIRLYLERRQRAGVATRTILQKELGTLRRILRLARDSGRLSADPFAGVRMPKTRGGRFEALPAATIEKAITTIRAANARHADLVELLWRTCLRRAEAARLRVEHVDLPNRTLFVIGKNVNRLRPISDRAVPVIERLVASAEEGRLVTSVRYIEKVFERWTARLKLPAFSPHVLRHSFATDLLSRGVAPAVVASLMGHSGLRMLDRYYHGQDPALRAAVEQLGASTGRPPQPPSFGTAQVTPAPSS
jgi:site-specific recombinase XerD